MRRTRIACLQKEFGRRLRSERICIVLVCAMALLWSAPNAQQAPTATEQVTLRRIVLLRIPLAATEDTRVSRLIATARSRHRRGRKSRSDTESIAPNRAATSPPTSRHALASDAEKATPEQLRAVADTLFADALADRLQDHAGVQVVPERDVTTALHTLNLSAAQAIQRRGAERLCNQLGCDALAVLRLTHFELREGSTREIDIRGSVTLPYFHTVSEAPTKRKGKPATRFTPPAQFDVVGVAISGKQFLRSTFSKTRASLVTEAAQKAAAQAVHTLRTGQVAPLTRSGVRVAIAPVSAPGQADKMLFTAQGRRVITASVSGLPEDISGRFTPDLTPLTEPQIVPAETCRQWLIRKGSSPARLWLPGDQPDIPQVQILGRQLHVDYVLLARITDLELEAGPPDLATSLPPSDPTEALHPASLSGTQSRLPDVSVGGHQTPSPAAKTTAVAQDGWEREARARAVGALIRVADGAMLWQDRASATMTLSSRAHSAGKAPVTDTRIAEDAIHFALASLQRELADYRAAFER